MIMIKLEAGELDCQCDSSSKLRVEDLWLASHSTVSESGRCLPPCLTPAPLAPQNGLAFWLDRQRICVRLDSCLALLLSGLPSHFPQFTLRAWVTPPCCCSPLFFWLSQFHQFGLNEKKSEAWGLFRGIELASFLPLGTVSLVFFFSLPDLEDELKWTRMLIVYPLCQATAQPGGAHQMVFFLRINSTPSATDLVRPGFPLCV